MTKINSKKTKKVAHIKNVNKIYNKKYYSAKTLSEKFFILPRIKHSDIIEESLKKAENLNEKKPKTKKQKIFSACFFLVNVLLVVLVFYNFSKEQGGIQPLSTLFANHPKWTYLFIALGLFILTVILNSLKFSILLFHRTRKFRPIFSLKLATIGRYYDFITPLGSGGQPFEIYYLSKDGYSADTSTAIPLAKYMIWQISFMLLSLFVLIAYSKNYISSPLVLVLAWIGLGITLLLFLFVFFISITKRFGTSLVVGVLKLLHKMKIIKNYRKVLLKVLRFVKSYQMCIKSFSKQPLTVISEVIVTTASIISNALIAFFIYSAFVEVPAVSWWDIVCKCIICDLATSFFPMPGGSGAQELSFNSLLGSLFPSGTLFWGVLIWRILTYYMYIAFGIVVIIIDMFKKKHIRRQNE